MHISLNDVIHDGDRESRGDTMSGAGYTGGKGEKHNGRAERWRAACCAR